MKKILLWMMILCLLPIVSLGSQEAQDPISRRMAAGAHHVLAVLPDGRAAAAGENEYRQCDVQDWADIVQVAAGESHSVGLKKDGTVVAAGSNEYGQCEVENWRDIVFIACGNHHTVGITGDGKMVAAGNNESGQCDVAEWQNVQLLAAGGNTTFAVAENGRMLVAGEQKEETEEQDTEEEILAEFPRQIAVVGDDLLLMLYNDGTLDYRGFSLRLYPNEWGMCGECNPGIDYWVDHSPHTATLWTEIVEVFCSDRFVMGLKKDGSVLVAGDVVAPDCGGVNLFAAEAWKNIVSLAVGRDFALGVDQNGNMHYASQPDGLMSGVKRWENIQEMTAAWDFALGVNADGSLQAWSAYEELYWLGDSRIDSAAWKQMKKLAMDEDMVAGIDQEGRVRLAGEHDFDKRQLEDAWARGKAKDIALCGGRVLILTEDGEVFFLGDVSGGLDVTGLSGAEKILLDEYAFGLMEDGSVKMAGMHAALRTFGAWNRGGSNPFAETENWKNIVFLALGQDVLYGLQADGTLVMAGDAAYSQAEALQWEDIVSISASPYHIAGLKEDGTVVAAGWNEALEDEGWGDLGTKNQCEVAHWEDVTQVIAVTGATLGVCKDGAILLAGANYADCSGALAWKLFEESYERQDTPLQEESERLSAIAKRKADHEADVKVLLDFLQAPADSAHMIREKHPEYEKLYGLHHGVSIFMQKGLYGLADETGRELLPAVYSRIERSNGIAILHDDEAQGLRLYEEKNRLLLPGVYESAGDMAGEYIRVYDGNEKGYLGRKGDMITEEAYHALQLPPYAAESLELYPFEQAQDREYVTIYGYRDEQEKTVIPPIFHQAFEFSDGLARVFLWGDEGYINGRGELVCGFEGLAERIMNK